jgi:hypothetical protein
MISFALDSKVLEQMLCSQNDDVMMMKQGIRDGVV